MNKEKNIYIQLLAPLDQSLPLLVLKLAVPISKKIKKISVTKKIYALEICNILIKNNILYKNK